MKKEENISVNTPSRSPEYRGGARLFFLFLLTALVIHFFLFLLFRPLPQELPAEKRASKNHTVLLLEGAPDYEKKLQTYQLKYALKYLEPRVAVQPDLYSGFSSVLQKGRSRTLLPELLPESSGKKTVPARSAFVLEVRPLGELSKGLRYEKTAKSPSPPEKGVLLPRWNLGDKRVITGWLVPDQTAEELLHQLGNRAGEATVLVVTKKVETLPPEIRIYSSSRVPALDQLAVKQLALYLGRNPAFAGNAAFFCSVLWRLPKLKEPIEVKE